MVKPTLNGIFAGTSRSLPETPIRPRKTTVVTTGKGRLPDMSPLPRLWYTDTQQGGHCFTAEQRWNHSRMERQEKERTGLLEYLTIMKRTLVRSLFCLWYFACVQNMDRDIILAKIALTKVSNWKKISKKSDFCPLQGRLFVMWILIEWTMNSLWLHHYTVKTAETIFFCSDEIFFFACLGKTKQIDPISSAWHIFWFLREFLKSFLCIDLKMCRTVCTSIVLKKNWIELNWIE